MKLVYNKEEQTLIENCLKGDRLAQREFYARYSKKMFGVCLGYANNRESAQDLLQEGFVKVFTNLHKYNGKGSLEGWIRRTIVNNTIDFYRRQANQVASSELTETHLTDNGDLNFNDALKELNVDDFLKITQELPEGYRMVLNLYIIEGYTHKEIAETLGVSEGTSKSQMAKAKKVLKKIIYKYIDKDLIETYEKRLS